MYHRFTIDSCTTYLQPLPPHRSIQSTAPLDVMVCPLIHWIFFLFPAEQCGECVATTHQAGDEGAFRPGEGTAGRNPSLSQWRRHNRNSCNRRWSRFVSVDSFLLRLHWEDTGSRISFALGRKSSWNLFPATSWRAYYSAFWRQIVFVCYMEFHQYNSFSLCDNFHLTSIFLFCSWNTLRWGPFQAEISFRKELSHWTTKSLLPHNHIPPKCCKKWRDLCEYTEERLEVITWY